jgi:bacterioferritin
MPRVQPARVPYNILKTAAFPTGIGFAAHFSIKPRRRRPAMQGDKTVIELLNRALTIELTAINQYFLHARMYRNWGFHALGRHEYEESIEEMHHADRLIERILFLEGAPNPNALGRLLIGEDVPECLNGDLQLERQGRDLYLEAVGYCEKVPDYVSREILESILSDTEDHIDYLETQLGLIEKIGLKNYLQSGMGEAEA